MAEIDGYTNKADSAVTSEELSTVDDIYAKDSAKRIREALSGVKGESHADASTTGNKSRS